MSSRPAQGPGASRRARPGSAGSGRGLEPRREGRAESVAEAGGTGAEAVATPTTPPPVTTRLAREIDGLDRR